MQDNFAPDKVRPLMWIIAVCIGIYVLEHFLSVSFGSLDRIHGFSRAWFNLSAENLQDGKLWTLFTYGFFHGSALHILFNILIIFIVGRLLEQSIGSRNTCLLFCFAVVIGGCVWAGFHYNSNAHLLGASAGATGMLILFCMLNPEERIQLLLFFVFPITIKRKWIAYAAIGIDGSLFFIVELPAILQHTPIYESVAHSAHLGGMLGGYLFFRWLQTTSSAVRGQTSSSGNWADVEAYPPGWVQKHKQTAAVVKKTSFKLNMQSKADMKAEVDRILDKINSDGFGALSEEEKKTLDKAGDQLKH